MHTLRQRLSLAATPHLVGELAEGQVVAATFRNHPLCKD